MAQDDFYDSLRAPSYADSLTEADDDMEDTGFFPETEHVEEITAAVENIAINSTEDAEDLSRLAIFGKKPQVKRRSQIRREQEAAAKEEAAKKERLQSSLPVSKPVPRSRSNSTVRAPSVPRANVPVATRPVPTAPVVRENGPVTRSQTRAVGHGTPSPGSVGSERQARSMDRNAAVVAKPGTANRRIQQSPAPTQEQFNQAVSHRAGSLDVAPGARRSANNSSAGTRPMPNRPINRLSANRPGVPVPAAGSATRPVATRPAISRPTPTRPMGSRPVSKATAPTTTMAARAKAPLADVPVRVRGPVHVAASPRPPMAFGSAARQPTEIVRQPVAVAARRSVVQPQPVNRTPRALKSADVQSVVDRLSKPKYAATPVRSHYSSTPNRIANTYTHGMRSAVKPRSRTGSRPASQASNVPDENFAAE